MNIIPIRISKNDLAIVYNLLENRSLGHSMSDAAATGTVRYLLDAIIRYTSEGEPVYVETY
jgi:hypothetical protein